MSNPKTPPTQPVYDGRKSEPDRLCYWCIGINSAECPVCKGKGVMY